VTVISIGTFPAINETEEKRCGGKWTPPSMEELESHSPVYRFPSLKGEGILKFLREQKFDLGIQGGTGFLKDNVIKAFRLGILNFHPGDVPAYRGMSAPEWQVAEQKPVISSCHLVDEGIDSGPVIAKRELDVAFENYESFRASIYPLTAKFVVDIVGEIIRNNGFVNPPQPQDESRARYLKQMNKEAIAMLGLYYLKINNEILS
jgi:methionyl-tRNA formyltransferase